MKSKIAKSQRRSKVFSEIIEIVNQTSAGRKSNQTQIAHKSLKSPLIFIPRHACLPQICFVFVLTTLLWLFVNDDNLSSFNYTERRRIANNEKFCSFSRTLTGADNVENERGVWRKDGTCEVADAN